MLETTVAQRNKIRRLKLDKKMVELENEMPAVVKMASNISEAARMMAHLYRRMADFIEDLGFEEPEGGE